MSGKLLCFLCSLCHASNDHHRNIKSQRAAFPSISLHSLLRSTSILTATLRPNGAPLLHLANGTAQAYDAGLGTWVSVADTWWSEGSDAWEGKLRVKSSNSAARNVLVSLEGAIAESAESIPGGNNRHVGASAGGTQTWWGAALTLGHLESRLHAAKVLDTPPQEYRHNLLLYAKRVAEEGFRGKAEELLKELCGPLYVYVFCHFSSSPDCLTCRFFFYITGERDEKILGLRLSWACRSATYSRTC